jgi:hypothetical protein
VATIILTSQLHPVSWAQCIHLELDSVEHIQVAQICKAISKDEKGPIHFVAFPGVAKHLPALQVFFRTNHLDIRSYVCVNELPEGHLGEWPDAPVSYIDFSSNQANLNLARLRNWNLVATTEAELQSEIISCVALYE